MVHKKSGGLYSEHITKFNQDPRSATVQCRNCVWIRLSDNVKADNSGRARHVPGLRNFSCRFLTKHRKCISGPDAANHSHVLQICFNEGYESVTVLLWCSQWPTHPNPEIFSFQLIFFTHSFVQALLYLVWTESWNAYKTKFFLLHLLEVLIKYAVLKTQLFNDNDNILPLGKT